MSALTTLEMDLDCNKWKKRSVSLLLATRCKSKKKRDRSEKIFSLERSGGSSHHRNHSIKEYLLDRMIAQKRFASKRTKKRARCSSFYTRRLGSFSLSRARERFPSSPNGPFFSHVWIFVSFKVGYAKSEFREKRARAPRKRRDLFPRTSIEKKKKAYAPEPWWPWGRRWTRFVE